MSARTERNALIVRAVNFVLFGIVALLFGAVMIGATQGSVGAVVVGCLAVIVGLVVSLKSSVMIWQLVRIDPIEE